MGILVAVFFILVCASFILSTYLERKVKQLDVPGFTLNVKTVKIKLLKQQVSLNEIELRDSLRLLNLNIKRIEIRDIHFFALLFKGNIGIDNLILQKPHIRIDTALFKSNLKGSSYTDNRTIDIASLKIRNATLLLVSSDTLMADTLYYTGFNININKLKQNGQPNTFSYQSTSFNRLQFSLQNGVFNFGKGLYAIKYNNLAYDSDKMKLNVDELNLLSLYSKYEMGRTTGFETDWFDFTFKDLELNTIRLKSLLSNTALVFSEGRIGNFQGEAFKDKRLPLPQKPDNKLPMTMLNALPIGLHCDSFFIDQAHIIYSERVDASDKAGTIYFKDLSARINHASTIDSLITKPTTMQAQARVMGEALLQADFNFPNKEYPKPYRAKGQMGSMPVRSFNPIIKQNAFVEANQGNIKNMAFDFTYNNDSSGGSLVFEYDDLKISILDKDDFSKKGVTSFIVNSFAVHNENLKNSKEFREGTIAFERNKKRSIFNYWWKSVLSGLKTIAIF
ncbi:hypothetical protein SAMN06265379_10395 [Saccharicrinis carchari]|uniref:DUF3971 domain-containing protein n=2 Tax=Saccharicrinis carchari TaxID=1168039 RepID=A0A521CFR9_SACCC|nr:hypothetical protein SAMN06265379_10395 [Saccharicrinis carchari]